MGEKVKAIRLTVDFYDHNEEFETTEDVVSQIEGQRYGFWTVRKAIRRDIKDYTDEHPLNQINNALYREESDKHFERGLLVYEGKKP